MKSQGKSITISFLHNPREIENTLNEISLELVCASDAEQLSFLLERLDVFSSKLETFSGPIYKLYEAHVQLIREQILEKLMRIDCK